MTGAKLKEISKNKWHFKALFLCNMAAAFLLTSWLWPPIRAFWDFLDFNVFIALNNTLRWGETYKAFWALANWRPFDMVQALIIMMIILYWVRSTDKTVFSSKILLLLFFAIWMVMLQQCFDEMLEIIDYYRRSPTLEIKKVALQKVVRLSKEITWIKTKDVSNFSFPSDHATVLMCVTVFIYKQGGRRIGLFFMAAVFPFYFPRLVSGAHWLTDIVVGSLFLTIVITSFWYATPLHSLASRIVDLIYPFIVKYLPAWARAKSEFSNSGVE